MHLPLIPTRSNSSTDPACTPWSSCYATFRHTPSSFFHSLLSPTCSSLLDPLHHSSLGISHTFRLRIVFHIYPAGLAGCRFNTSFLTLPKSMSLRLISCLSPGISTNSVATPSDFRRSAVCRPHCGRMKRSAWHSEAVQTSRAARQRRICP